jgi:hypothetical protein
MHQLHERDGHVPVGFAPSPLVTAAAPAAVHEDVRVCRRVPVLPTMPWSSRGPERPHAAFLLRGVLPASRGCMRKTVGFVGAGFFVVACGSSSGGGASSGGSCASGEGECVANSQSCSGEDIGQDTCASGYVCCDHDSVDAGHAPDAHSDALPDSEGETGVACGSIVCAGGQYCVQPYPCGGADTGTPCPLPPPFCASLPVACNQSTAQCSCLGAQSSSVCEVDGGPGGECMQLSPSQHTLTCGSA